MKRTLLYAGVLMTSLCFGQDINININMDGTGFNANASVTDSTGSTSINTSATTNLTVDSSSTSTSSTTVITNDTATWVDSPVIESGEGGTLTTTTCSTSDAELQRIKSTIDNESFGDDKMNVARQALQNRCVSTEQVAILMRCFSFEDEKLALAKMAYEHTTDTENYYQLNSEFQFSDSKQQLNSFINSQN